MGMKILLPLAVVLVTLLSSPTTLASERMRGYPNFGTVSELKADLVGKTKAEIKALFGRAPDQTAGPDMWEYKGFYRDPDAETTMGMISIAFNDDGAVAKIYFFE